MDSQRRTLLFLLVCVPVRALIAYATYRYVGSYPTAIASALGLASVGFANTYATSNPAKDKGFFGGPAWWHVLRPVHAVLYGIAAVMAMYRNADAYVPLALDLCLGIGSFLRHTSL